MRESTKQQSVMLAEQLSAIHCLLFYQCSFLSRSGRCAVCVYKNIRVLPYLCPKNLFNGHYHIENRPPYDLLLHEYKPVVSLPDISPSHGDSVHGNDNQ